jgi:hypothetical protein
VRAAKRFRRLAELFRGPCSNETELRKILVFQRIARLAEKTPEAAFGSGGRLKIIRDFAHRPPEPNQFAPAQMAG